MAHMRNLYIHCIQISLLSTLVILNFLVCGIFDEMQGKLSVIVVWIVWQQWIPASANRTGVGAFIYLFFLVG